MKIERDIREKLGKFPKDLIETYDQLYSLIENEQEYGREVAKGALRWVLCTQKPLTMEMLLEFTGYTTHNKLTAEDLLELCLNLLTWYRAKDMVQLSSFDCHKILLSYPEFTNR